MADRIDSPAQVGVGCCVFRTTHASRRRQAVDINCSHYHTIRAILRYSESHTMPTPNKSEDTKSNAPEGRVRRRGHWFVIILLVAGMAPTVLSGAGQVPSLLRLFYPKLAQAVTFESGTLHWWSEVRLANIVVRDLTAEVSPEKSAIPAFTADVVATRQPLWKLAMSAGRDIEITIERPILNVRVFDGTSNIEQTFRQLFPDTDASGTSRAPAIDLTVSQGSIRLISEGSASADAAVLAEINGQFLNRHSPPGLPIIAVTAYVGGPADGMTAQRDDLMADGVNPRIAATLDDLAGDFPRHPLSDEPPHSSERHTRRPAFSLQLGEWEESADCQQLIIEARQLDLTKLRPLVHRFLPDAVCCGKCSCRVQARLQGPTAAHGVAGRLQFLGEGIQWRQKSWAAGEMLDLNTVAASGAVALAADGVLLQGLRIQSNILDVTGDGEVMLGPEDPVSVMRAGNERRTSQRQHVVSEAAAAASGQVRLNGRIDLAAISRMIPRTLTVSDDVVIDSGSLRFSCRVQRASPTGPKTPGNGKPAAGLQWRLAAETSPLQANRAEHRITVNSPMRVTAIGSAGPDDMELRRATIDADFGSISAEPIDGGIAIRGSISPSRLWHEVRQLTDLPQPRIEGDVKLEVDVRRDGEVFNLQNILLESSEVRVQSRLLTVDPSGNILQTMDGSLTVEGATAALKTLVAPWHHMPWLSGNSTLVAHLNAQPEQRLTLKADLRRNRRIAPPVFGLSEGRIDASIIADRKTGAFVVERGRIELPGLRSDVTGTLAVRHGLLTVNLSADTAYDLESLSKQFSADKNSPISVSGQGQDTFHFRGAPSLLTEADVNRFRERHPDASLADAPSITPMFASGQIAWQGGSVYGLPLGPGSATAEFQRGRLRTEPIHCDLGSGQIDVMPQWDLAGHRIQLASGSRIRNLELTPQLCKEWLGYIAPMMAEATNVHGRFSARVHRFDYHVDRPEQSMVHAVLTVHDATAAPGASLDQLVQLVSVLGKGSTRDTGSIELPGQEVAFELRDGMVIHDGLQIVIGGYNMTSRGGVGFSRDLRLALDVPLEHGVSGRDNSVRIPFSGTIDRPQLDASGLLQNLGKQQIGNRVNEQIDRGLNRLLDKLR